MAEPTEEQLADPMFKDVWETLEGTIGDATTTRSCD